MKQKSSSFTALWFIPLVALIFAGLFTIVGVIGWKLLKNTAPQNTAPAKSAQTAQARTAPSRQAATQRGANTTATRPTTAAATQPQEPLALPTSPRARFELGLQQCLSRTPEQYPCGWQDSHTGVTKQFKIEKPGDPIVRRVFDMSGQVLNMMAFNTQRRYVIMYRQGDTTWSFDTNRLVRQIAKTSAADRNLQDYYFYTVTGQLNSCVCADKTQACCANAPQVASPGNRFCELFPLDEEICADA